MGDEFDQAGIVRPEQASQILEHVGEQVEVGCVQRHVGARMIGVDLVDAQFHDRCLWHAHLRHPAQSVHPMSPVRVDSGPGIDQPVNITSIAATIESAYSC